MRIKVLLVEDQNSFIFTEILNTHNGIDFTVEKRGDRAIARARGDKFDCILMDVRIPCVNGIEAIKQIRGFDKETPIIAITAYGDKNIRQEALEAGANRFITKPPNYTDLYNLIVKLSTQRLISNKPVAAIDRIDSDTDRLVLLQRRLSILKHQQAIYGVDAPPRILMEIEDLETEIARLQENN